MTKTHTPVWCGVLKNRGDVDRETSAEGRECEEAPGEGSHLQAKNRDLDETSLHSPQRQSTLSRNQPTLGLELLASEL